MDHTWKNVVDVKENTEHKDQKHHKAVMAFSYDQFIQQGETSKTIEYNPFSS